MNLIGAVVVVLLPIFTAKILSDYGLKEMFLFLAGINFVTIIMAISYIPLLPGNQNERKRDRIRESFGLEVLRKRKFAFWCLASAFGMFGYLIPVVNIVNFKFKYKTLI